MKVGLVGSRGFVGSATLRALRDKHDHQIVEITRDNYAVMAKKHDYDVLINCAMPSRRFWAAKNPLLDFESSVELTAKLFHGWKFEKFVQVSSISARSQLETVYGRHKAASEAICKSSISLIVRLGPMYGDDLAKGVLVDMLNNSPVFVDASSRYCFAPVEWVGQTIAQNMFESGTIEIGARNSVQLGDLAKEISSKSEFHGITDHQEVDLPMQGAPCAFEVINFLNRSKSA